MGVTPKEHAAWFAANARLQHAQMLVKLGLPVDYPAAERAYDSAIDRIKSWRWVRQAAKDGRLT